MAADDVERILRQQLPHAASVIHAFMRNKRVKMAFISTTRY
jgi:hypothetical protein